MAKRRLPKTPHMGKRLLEQKIPISKILPGMLLTFEYSEPKIYDRRPLILVLGKVDNRIEGVNFNYIKESEITRFYKECVIVGVEPRYENFVKLSKDYIRVRMNTKFTPSRFDGKVIYQRIFKRYQKFRDAFRSYKIGSMTSPKIVNYKIKGIEEARTQMNLLKEIKDED